MLPLFADGCPGEITIRVEDAGECKTGQMWRTPYLESAFWGTYETTLTIVEADSGISASLYYQYPLTTPRSSDADIALRGFMESKVRQRRDREGLKDTRFTKKRCSGVRLQDVPAQLLRRIHEHRPETRAANGVHCACHGGRVSRHTALLSRQRRWILLRL